MANHLFRASCIDELILFRQFIFGLVSSTTHEDFSSKVSREHLNNPKFTGNLQDSIIHSWQFTDLVNNPAWRVIASVYLKSVPEDVLIVFPFFRIDLPSSFTDDEQKMSLSWHQEAAYFLHRGSCTTSSIVLSTYLHDCDSCGGGLLLSRKSLPGLIEHSDFFLDEVNQRFRRFNCVQPQDYFQAESRFGETLVFDFLRPHRSGVNHSPLVRLTLLLRATSRSHLEAEGRCSND